ncbi:hypothetical protein HXA34_20170 [Salipaludibacillus agaradhaerens]|uniref:hypothetical protein n=1 Tax=Salipaludibacillus agaradhaerens TaxID=76935 RepID=UPI002151E81D|nr:hypothetical protein [Salipaludibacillus agaradhaerens]MCR6108609.1 hypothetical protein [Salipaludibacillus agaradhaerens]MCR6120637.1 hypothetical protein [Salipaludibacillus agaradhaerens]
MFRFLYEYRVKSTGVISTISIHEKSEVLAKEKIKERIADMEFTEIDDVEIIRLVKKMALKDNYYECEGCT